MSEPPVLHPVPDLKQAADADAQAAAFYRELEIDTLARTLWGEARGEGKAGMEAVAMVILNRVAIAKRLNGYWWGNNLIEVCQKPFQFSCWNKTDANFKKIVSLTVENDIFFATAMRIARRVMLGFVKDVTGGATHYHARTIRPAWAREARPSAIIGRHIFYRLVEV